MEDDLDQDEEKELEAPESARWSWVAFWSWFVTGVGSWFNLCGLNLAILSGLMDAHVQWKANQRDAMRQAAIEMDALIKVVEKERVDAVTGA